MAKDAEVFKSCWATLTDEAAENGGDWMTPDGWMWACCAEEWNGFEIDPEARRFRLLVTFEATAGYTQCIPLNEASIQIVSSGRSNALYTHLAQWFKEIGVFHRAYFWMKIEAE
jgi:hypothetical protein